jgi:hypothetical protein
LQATQRGQHARAVGLDGSRDGVEVPAVSPPEAHTNRRIKAIGRRLVRLFTRGAGCQHRVAH